MATPLGRSLLHACIFLLANGQAMPTVQQMVSFYNPNTMSALAALSKFAYCSIPFNTIQLTANSGGTYDPVPVVQDYMMKSAITKCSACKNAGLAIEPGTVSLYYVSDDGGPTVNMFDPQANFFFVAAVKRPDSSRGCVVSFRGMTNAANSARYGQTTLADISSYFPDCKGCTVHAGFWAVALKTKDLVKSALNKAGCGPANPVWLTGHGYGGAVATLVTLWLSEYNISTSYMFEPPRLGNAAFSAYQVPDPLTQMFFRVTNNNDAMPLFPSTPGYVSSPFEIYSSTANLEYACPVTDSTNCGILQQNITSGPLNSPSGMGSDNCNLYFAPLGNICPPTGNNGDPTLRFVEDCGAVGAKAEIVTIVVIVIMLIVIVGLLLLGLIGYLILQRNHKRPVGRE